MDFSNIKNKFFVVLCVFIVLFPFILMTNIYATEDDETLQFTRVYNLTLSPNSNVFTSGSNSVGYLQIEPNYIYTVYLPDNLTNYRYFAVSTEPPVVDGLYTYIGSAIGGETFTYRSTSNSYLYLDYGSYNSSVTVTRRKAGGQDVAIDDLVSNVGVDSVWNIFDISINYIYIAVLVAFGVFIVGFVIKKITKGKEGF